MITVNWLEPEGRNKGYPFLFTPHVPTSSMLELHITSQAEICIHGDCKNQWEFLLGKPPRFGPFIFSSVLLLWVMFSVWKISTNRSFHQPNHFTDRRACHTRWGNWEV